MISQQTEKELTYLWNTAKAAFSFNETFVEPINPDLNAPENSKTLKIIERYKWERHAGKIEPRHDGAKEAEYSKDIDRSILNASELIKARITFNAAQATLRYFRALAHQDKFADAAIQEFFALKDIRVPDCAFAPSGETYPVAETFKNDPACVNINDAVETAVKVTSCRYDPADLLLNKKELLYSGTTSMHTHKADLIIRKCTKGKDEFSSACQWPSDLRDTAIDKDLRAVDEYCARETFIRTALREASYLDIPFGDMKNAIKIAAPHIMKFNGSKQMLDSNEMTYNTALEKNKKEGYIQAIRIALEDSGLIPYYDKYDLSKTDIFTRTPKGESLNLTAAESTLDDMGTPDINLTFEPGHVDIKASNLSVRDLESLSTGISQRIERSVARSKELSVTSGGFASALRSIQEKAALNAAEKEWRNRPALSRLFSSRPKNDKPVPVPALMENAVFAAGDSFLKVGTVSDDKGSMTLSIEHADHPYNSAVSDGKDRLLLYSKYKNEDSMTFNSVMEISVTEDGNLRAEHVLKEWGRNYREDTPSMKHYNTITTALERFVEAGCKGYISEEYENKPLVLSFPSLKPTQDVTKQQKLFMRLKNGGVCINMKAGESLVVDAVSDQQEGFHVVKKDGRFNYMSSDGELLCRHWLDRALPFKDGTAKCSIGNSFFEINKEGIVLKKETLLEEKKAKGMKM